jgi:hypothetical protein
MAYTSNNLISDAYFTSGILARELETVSGTQFSDGLNFLNEVIALNKVSNKLIPYDSVYQFDSVIGQEVYLFADLLEINTLTYIKDNVRYSMERMSQQDYLQPSRAEDINSLPTKYYYEREFVANNNSASTNPNIPAGGAGIPVGDRKYGTGGKLYMYFRPDQVYPFTINGKSALAEVTLAEDLLLRLDRFYITYLKYALAERLCAEYNFEVPPMLAKQLARYQNLIAGNSSKMDLSLQKTSWVGDLEAQSYFGYANLGTGWMP